MKKCWVKNVKIGTTIDLYFSFDETNKVNRENDYERKVGNLVPTIHGLVTNIHGAHHI